MYVFTIFIIVTACMTKVVLGSNISSGESSCEAELFQNHRARDCLKHDFGKCLQCIGTLHATGAIDNKTAELLTHQALDKLPNKDTYYSVGVQVGNDPKVIVGKQKHYDFDWEVSIPTRIYNVMSDSTLITSFKKSKPVLLYTSNFDVDVQEMPEWSNSLTIPRIGDGMYPMYRHSEAKGGQLKLNCEAYEKWETRKKIMNVGIVVIMPNSMWCPSSASAYFEVVVGEIDIVSEKHGKSSYYLKWFKARDSSSGEIPDWVPKDF